MNMIMIIIIIIVTIIIIIVVGIIFVWLLLKLLLLSSLLCDLPSDNDMQHECQKLKTRWKDIKNTKQWTLNHASNLAHGPHCIVLHGERTENSDSEHWTLNNASNLIHGPIPHCIVLLLYCSVLYYSIVRVRHASVRLPLTCRWACSTSQRCTSGRCCTGARRRSAPAPSRTCGRLPRLRSHPHPGPTRNKTNSTEKGQQGYIQQEITHHKY